MIKYLGILLFSSICLFNCQMAEPQEVAKNEKNLYVNYYVRYSVDNSRWRVEAIINELDSASKKVSYTLPKGISFQGKKMKESQQKDYIKYKQALRSDTISTCRFEFEDEVGNMQTHEIPVANFDSLSIETDIKRSKGFVIRWQGDNIKKGETMVILISDTSGKTLSRTFMGPSTGNQVPIQPEQIEPLELGKAKINIIKRGSHKIEKKDNITGNASMEYYLPTIDVNIVK